MWVSSDNGATWGKENVILSETFGHIGYHGIEAVDDTHFYAVYNSWGYSWAEGDCITGGLFEVMGDTVTLVDSVGVRYFVNSSNQASAPAMVGSSGGGGGSSATGLFNSITKAGVMAEDVEARDIEWKVTLYLHRGLTLHNGAGAVLYVVSIKDMLNPPSSTQNGIIIGKVYTINPVNADISEPVYVEFKYSEDMIPPNVIPSSVSIREWNANLECWELVQSTVSSSVVTAWISHFGNYALVADYKGGVVQSKLNDKVIPANKESQLKLSVITVMEHEASKHAARIRLDLLTQVYTK